MFFWAAVFGVLIVPITLIDQFWKPAPFPLQNPCPMGPRAPSGESYIDCRIAARSWPTAQAISSALITAGGAIKMWSPAMPSTDPCMG